MINVKISQNYDNMYYIRNNSKLKFIYDDKNECINYTLSLSYNQNTVIHPKDVFGVSS